MLVKGVDTDNYDGEIETTRFRRLYEDHGMRFQIPGCEAGQPYVAQQLKSSGDLGYFHPFVYKFVYGTDHDVEGLAAATNWGLPVCVDVESSSGILQRLGNQDAVVQRLITAKAVLLDHNAFWGWYSNKAEWQMLTGGYNGFAGDNSWVAAYPFSKLSKAVLPPEDFPSPQTPWPEAFGGTIPKVWQYANICYGEPGFDMNVMWQDDPQPQPVPPQGPRTWLVGNEQGGIEIRWPGGPGQQLVVWNLGKDVFAWGGALPDDTPGQLAKRFGADWRWLRLWEYPHPDEPTTYDAYWSSLKGD